jgi:hypothetical protein
MTAMSDNLLSALPERLQLYLSMISLTRFYFVTGLRNFPAKFTVPKSSIKEHQ